jgi:hypothetical protein
MFGTIVIFALGLGAIAWAYKKNEASSPHDAPSWGAGDKAPKPTAAPASAA